jgi:hypothetical protein
MVKQLLYGTPPFSKNTVNNSKDHLFRARHLNLDGQFECLENGIEGIA